MSLRHCRSVRINPARLSEEERFLPPGTMRDIWEQMVALEKGMKPVSFAQFWRVWKAEYPHLKFRSTSSHAICAVCTRHKMLLKEMGHHLRARSAQRELYNQHLHNQYRDRAEYWRRRAASRLGGADVTIIADSMDQAKFAYPRGDVFRSKDLGSFQRPRAHITGVIAHGHLTLFSVSSQDLRKDSNTMVELVSHTLTLLSQRGYNLRKCSLSVQCDNTTRELKNNPMMKYLCYLVSNSVVAKASLCALRTGHSHEDIDQLFGQLARFLATKARVAATPEDFVDIIQRWMDVAMKRPFEPGKHCVYLDQTRNWQLGLRALVCWCILCQPALCNFRFTWTVCWKLHVSLEISIELMAFNISLISTSCSVFPSLPNHFVLLEWL